MAFAIRRNQILDGIADITLSGIAVVVINFFFVLAADKILGICSKVKKDKKKRERSDWF